MPADSRSKIGVLTSPLIPEKALKIHQHDLKREYIPKIAAESSHVLENGLKTQANDAHKRAKLKSPIKEQYLKVYANLQTDTVVLCIVIYNVYLQRTMS